MGLGHRTQANQAHGDHGEDRRSRNLEGADSPAMGIGANRRLTPGTPYMSAAATSAVLAGTPPASGARDAGTPPDSRPRAGIRLLFTVVGQPGAAGRVAEASGAKALTTNSRRNDHGTDGNGPAHRGDNALAHVLEEARSRAAATCRAQQDGWQQPAEGASSPSLSRPRCGADDDRPPPQAPVRRSTLKAVSGCQPAKSTRSGGEQRHVAQAAVAPVR